MKLALLGTGMIVKEVLPVLKEIEDIELVAILATPRSLDSARELAEIYGLAQATSDYEAVLNNPEVDTVYVGLPNHLHYDYAKKNAAGASSPCNTFSFKLLEASDGYRYDGYPAEQSAGGSVGCSERR